MAVLDEKTQLLRVHREQWQVREFDVYTAHVGKKACFMVQSVWFVSAKALTEAFAPQY
jgi:hypothetical protein